MHDPEVYEDPDVFRPDRFIRNGELDPTVRDPAAFVFGFGRRYVGTKVGSCSTWDLLIFQNMSWSSFC